MTQRTVNKTMLAVLVESDDGEFLSPHKDGCGNQGPALWEPTLLGRKSAADHANEWMHPKVGAKARVVTVRVSVSWE